MKDSEPKYKGIVTAVDGLSFRNINSSSNTNWNINRDFLKNIFGGRRGFLAWSIGELEELFKYI